MPDIELGTILGNVHAASLAPALQRRRFPGRHFDGRRQPTVEQRCLQILIAGLDMPITALAFDAVADGLKALPGSAGGRRPQRRPETLVGFLMTVYQLLHTLVPGFSRVKFDTPVVAEGEQHRGADAQTALRQCFQPGVRNQVQQRGGRNESLCRQVDPIQITRKIPLGAGYAAFESLAR